MPEPTTWPAKEIAISKQTTLVITKQHSMLIKNGRVFYLNDTESKRFAEAWTRGV
jgi:hypothetical protein